MSGKDAGSTLNETKVLAEFVLGPCLREGEGEDWWREQHVFCTGSHHMGPGEIVKCSCDCHRNVRYIVPAIELPPEVEAILRDESVVLPGEERAWQLVAAWVRGKYPNRIAPPGHPDSFGEGR